MKRTAIRIAAAAVFAAATFQAIAAAPTANTGSVYAPKSGPGVPIPTCGTAHGCDPSPKTN
jgi:hypothetical protein